MKNFPYFGPSITVLIAGGAALVLAPMVVRRVNDEQAKVQIAQATFVLGQDARLDSGLKDRVALEGARDPLGDEPSASSGKQGVGARQVGREASRDSMHEPIHAPVHESILEQINRANRAIARLVEPSVVHVSAQNLQRRRGFVAPFASSGSGWIWDDSGHIVTNAHVVEGAERLQVQFFDGELRDAELVGLDLRTDIAVIKVASGGVQPSLRGDSALVEQGDMVYAFGSPFDFRFSMSAGIVSGLGRSTALDNIDYQNFIQTDAAINPGNSGGPLTDVRGRVIAMNTAIATNQGNTVGQAQFAGIGLAIPMSMIESTVTQLIETGEVRKGYLGIQVVTLEAARFGATPYSDIAERFKGEGAMASLITKGSPAEAAGFRGGDIILTIDGQKVNSDGAVRAVVSSRQPGESVRFEIWRLQDGAQGDGKNGSKDGSKDGVFLELTATLAQLDSSVSLAPRLPNALGAAGIKSFSTATDERAAALAVPFRRGVLIEEIASDSELAAQIPKGSVITAVFNQTIGSVDELYTRFARTIESMDLSRGRRRSASIVEVPLTITVPDGRVAQIIVPCPAF
jgi:serine protease Do